MIYVDLKGRLGNQLFEYAFARNMQKKTKQKICISSYNLNMENADYSNVELHHFKLNDNVIFTQKKLPWWSSNKSIGYKIIQRINCHMLYELMMKKNIYIWDKPQKSNLVEPLTEEDLFISGYWQSEEYFLDVSDILKKELVVKYQKKKCNEELYEIIEKNETVCVSIRRGDYVKNEKFRNKYYICDKKYFTHAIEIIKRKIKMPILVFFSDDIEWAKGVFGGEYHGMQCVYESGKDEVWEKLRLMAECKHFIISNSSFSWWAQYLRKGNNPDSVIVAPSRWYKDEDNVCIYQSNWLLIE